jgi:hypothetical protein
MIARTTLATASAALAVLLLSGCGAADPELDALRSEPLVTADVRGLTETQLFGQIEFTSLGKHEPATLTRLFETGTHRVAAADLARAAEVAKAGGWELRPGRNGRWTGTKKVDGVPTDLLIRRSVSSSQGVLVAVIMTATS